MTTRVGRVVDVWMRAGMRATDARSPGTCWMWRDVRATDREGSRYDHMLRRWGGSVRELMSSTPNNDEHILAKVSGRGLMSPCVGDLDI